MGLRALYLPGHREFVVRCRARFNRLREYARAEKIPFSVTHEDVKRLLRDLPDFGNEYRIERLDSTGSFVPDNLIARKARLPARKRSPLEAKGVEAAVLTDEALRQAVAKVVEKRANKAIGSSATSLTVGDLVKLYFDQDGSCAASFLKLSITEANRPESLDVSRRDPNAPWTIENTVLVARCVKAMVDRHGIESFIQAAKNAAKKHKRPKPEVVNGS